MNRISRHLSYFIITVLLSSGFLVIGSTVWADTNDLVIIPTDQTTVEPAQIIDDISQSGGKIWSEYNKKAFTDTAEGGVQGELGSQLASGVMTWDTLLDYVVYLLEFLSQIGLLIGSLMVIYTGYQYAAAAFTNSPPSSDLIMHAIAGILVVIFSRAIIMILTRAFLT